MTVSDDLSLFKQEAQRVSALNSPDLENEKRRVRSIAKTAEGREALRQELGYNFLFAEEALKDGRPLVSLLCPTRTVPEPETTRAVDAMIRASRPSCILTPEPGVSMSVVHWSRNKLLVRLREAKHPADYVLFVDDDMEPPEDALVKLLKHDLDIVAGACTVRQDPPHPNFRTWHPEKMQFFSALDWRTQGGVYLGHGETGGLVEVGGVGAAFMLVKTPVLDKVGEYYLSCRFEREHFGMSDAVAEKLSAGRRAYAKENGNEWWFQFLQHPLGEGEWGEDLSFCFKARECGYKVFVDTSVEPGHMGSYPYKLADYLSYQAEEIGKAKQKKAEQEVAQ
jgi:hypothetical protein